MSAPHKRIVSGIQPSGELHLGNYFGAIQHHIALQDEGDCFYFIADYHALTTSKDPVLLRQRTFAAACVYLALGLDPNKAVLYRQSAVPTVTELAWLLSTTTSMGLLERAPSYKDKVARGISASAGLFTYPVLMAADILAFRADIVPVGADQLPHIDICRDIVKAFNALYGDVFTLPSPKVTTAVPVPGLDGQKMSKSYNNIIPIFASDKELKKAIMRIVTDSTPLEKPKAPDKCVVFRLYSLLASQHEISDLRQKYQQGGFGYGDAKKLLIQKMEEVFGVFRDRYYRFLATPDDVEDILREGGRRASAAAKKVVDRVRTATGLGGI